MPCKKKLSLLYIILVIPTLFEDVKRKTHSVGNCWIIFSVGRKTFVSYLASINQQEARSADHILMQII
jgi:hypothetical protein